MTALFLLFYMDFLFCVCSFYRGFLRCVCSFSCISFCKDFLCCVFFSRVSCAVVVLFTTVYFGVCVCFFLYGFILVCFFCFCFCLRVSYGWVFVFTFATVLLLWWLFVHRFLLMPAFFT